MTVLEKMIRYESKCYKKFIRSSFIETKVWKVLIDDNPFCEMVKEINEHREILQEMSPATIRFYYLIEMGRLFRYDLITPEESTKIMNMASSDDIEMRELSMEIMGTYRKKRMKKENDDRRKKEGNRRLLQQAPGSEVHESVV